VAWGTDADWHIAFDYKADLSDTSSVKNRLAGGLEVLVGDALALRSGVTWDTNAQQWWLSAGAGLLTRRAACRSSGGGGSKDRTTSSSRPHHGLSAVAQRAIRGATRGLSRRGVQDHSTCVP